MAHRQKQDGNGQDQTNPEFAGQRAGFVAVLRSRRKRFWVPAAFRTSGNRPDGPARFPGASGRCKWFCPRWRPRPGSVPAPCRTSDNRLAGPIPRRDTSDKNILRLTPALPPSRRDACGNGRSSEFGVRSSEFPRTSAGNVRSKNRYVCPSRSVRKADASSTVMPQIGSVAIILQSSRLAPARQIFGHSPIL